jgi:hypothetical protein
VSKKSPTIDGPFVPHRRDMLQSPAWCELGLSARRVLDRMELELMAHGGTQENGRLPVTYNDFIKYRVRRNSIASALREESQVCAICAQSFSDEPMAKQVGRDERVSPVV